MKKIISIFGAVCLMAASATAVVPSAEKLLPDDTLMMLTIPDFLKAREIYQNSPQGQLWTDPAMKAFKDKFIGKFQSDYLTPLEHDMGVHFSEYTNLLQGQFTIALVQNGWMAKAKDANDPGLLVLLDTKGKSNQLKSNIADLKKKWVDAGKTARTERIRDVDFSVIVISTNDVPKTLKKKAPASPDAPEPMEDPDAKNAPKKQLYIGQADSLLILGNSPKAIEKVLAALSGGSVKTLTDYAPFSANAMSMFHDVPLFGWVNSKALIDIYMHKDEGSDDNGPSPFGFSPTKAMAALGLNGLKTIAFNYSYSSDGAQFNLMFGAPEAERAGLLKILAGEAKDYAPPGFVPADAVKFQRWRLDGQKLWAAVHKIASDISPQSAGGIDFMLGSAESAAKEKDPAFDLKKNLFGNLGDDLITYQKNPKGLSLEEINSAPSLFLLGSPNPEQLGGAIKNLLVLYQPPTEREFLGHKIYSVPLPASPSPKGEAGAAHSISYACSGSYVAISTDPAMIEEYLRSSEGQIKALRDTPGLADATQKVGGSGTSLFGFSNESESMRVFLEVLKKDPTLADPLANFNAMAAITGVGGDTKLKDWVDVSLLPTFDKISKYFYFAVYGGSASAEGLSFKVFAPTPPALKKESAATPAPAAK